MKRLFVCLFVCAMSLVNVADADYLPWSTVEPDNVIWKTATVTVNPNYSVSITGGIGFENVNVYDYLGYNSSNTADGKLTIYLKDAGLQNSAYLEFKRTPDSAANGHQGLVKVGNQSEKWNASAPTENPIFLTATGNSLIESIYVEYQKQRVPFTFEVSFSGTRNEEGDVDTTPEPASMLIFGLGLAGLGLCRRMRKK